jgi:hypothetical protein
MIRLFGREPWSLDSLTPPWGELKSIYDRIRSGVLEPLPDDDVVFKPNRFRWVGGAMDGVLARQEEGAEKEKRVFAIVSTLQQLEQRADNKSLKTLYEAVVENALVGCIDAVIEQMTKSDRGHNEPRLREIGRYFAGRAGHREAVKFGLALIGAFGDAQDSELLKTLGKSDEFTLFAGIALARVSDHPEKALWDLAKEVHGWGRVQIVRRLKDTDDSEIQAWMLREGFRNNIMDEYLACICARAGKLHLALNEQFVDTIILDAATEMIRALITGGPAEDIDDYEHSGDACEGYLNIVWSRTDLNLRHFLTVAKLKWFLTQPDGWERRNQKQWTDSRRGNMQSLADDVVGRESWRSKIADALSSENDQIFHEGDEAAQVLSIDTWELHFLRVRAKPLASSSWYRLMQQTNESRINEVLTFAESILPFERIETGPGDELGLGPNYQPHQALDWILQDLRRFPGHGWRMIKAGLRSPVVRNRNMAINALSAWDPKSWSTEMRSAVELALGIEPRADVKKRLADVLAPAKAVSPKFHA